MLLQFQYTFNTAAGRIDRINRIEVKILTDCVRNEVAFPACVCGTFM